MQTNELLSSYHPDPNTWDEMYEQASVRNQYRNVVDFLQQLKIRLNDCL